MACSVSVINCSEERKNTRKFDWKMVFFSDQNVIYDLEMDQELVSSCSWNSLRYLESRVRNQWNQERPLQQSLLLQHWNKALYNSPLPWKIVQAGSVCFGEISASQPVLGTKKHTRGWNNKHSTISLWRRSQEQKCPELLTFLFSCWNRDFPMLELSSERIPLKRNEIKSLGLMVESFLDRKKN